MPTVIDSLILELGLDPSKFTAGQKKAAESVAKTKEQVIRAGKELEESGTHTERAFSRMRDSIIALFTAFEVGRGLKQFIASITSADANVGRLAKTMDMSGKTLASWQGATRLLGGSADGITQSMMGLSQQMQHFLLTGESSVIPYFRALGISIEDSNGHLKTVNDLFLELADRFKNMDPARAEAFGKALGLDQGTINLLMQGRSAVEAYLKVEEKLAPTKADIEAAQERQKSFALLDQTLTKLGRTILTSVSPYLVAAMDAMRKWVDANRVWISQKINEYVQKFAQWVQSVNWPAVAKNVQNFMEEVKKLVDQLGGAQRVGEGLLAIFAINRIKPILGVLGLLAGTSGIGLITLAAAGASAGLDALFNKLLAAPVDKLNQVLHIGLTPAQKAQAQQNLSTKYGGSTPWQRIMNLWGHKGYSGEYQDVEYFISKGWTPAQAQGIVANIQRESGGNMAATGDNGAAYGLAQWHSDRRALFERLYHHDMAHGSRAEQLAFIDYELRHGQGGAQLSRATTAGAAGAAVSQYFERPANAAQEAALRASMATNLSHHEVNIREVNVNTQATDSDGIAKSIGPALKRNLLTQQGNSGVS